MEDWSADPGLMSAMGLGVEEDGAGAVCSMETVDEPVASDSRPGFIDSDDGSNIRTRPAELPGSMTLTSAPLPPATRVFVSGRHPQTADWWYVTAFLPDSIVRGYVQGLRVTVDLPEPTAKLYQIKSGDTAEGLAAREFSQAVRDGHDLRYYENVLLFVNRQHGRAGVRGSYQDPGLLGGGANNVQLEAGRRIWLVNPAYARALEGVVPGGSLTNGAVAKVKRFVGHIEDLVKSVTESPNHLGEVSGEYARLIHDNMPKIMGVVAGFIMAEAMSAFLASSPTGVGQIAAVMIQLALAAFGAAGMVVASVQALEHAQRWLTLAWTAGGKEERIAMASKELIKMLVCIAMAALAWMGVKGNLNTATTIASSMPPMMPALAVAGGGQLGQAGATSAVATGVPSPFGPFGTAMAMSSNKIDESSGPSAKDGAAEGSSGGSGSNVVIEGAADAAHETAQATRFASAEGGGRFRFLGNVSEGIEGFFRRTGASQEIPVSLKDFTATGKIRNILGRINKNAAHVVSAGHGGRTVLHARVSATVDEMVAFVEGGPLSRMPAEGTFQRMIFECTDGIVEVTVAGVVRR